MLLWHKQVFIFAMKVHATDLHSSTQAVFRTLILFPFSLLSWCLFVVLEVVCCLSPSTSNDYYKEKNINPDGSGKRFILSILYYIILYSVLFGTYCDNGGSK